MANSAKRHIVSYHENRLALGYVPIVSHFHLYLVMRHLGSGRGLVVRMLDSRVVGLIPTPGMVHFEAEAISFIEICLSILSYK